MKISNNLQALRLVGNLLYGEYWQKQMANTLNVSTRTMSRWEQEEFVVPDILPDGSTFSEHMLDLLEKRGNEIDEAINQIQKLVPAPSLRPDSVVG